MIDIHSHIIFDVDDGPRTLEESMQLIAESYAQGVRGIVSTSHRRKGMFETPEEKIRAHYEIVEAEVAKRFPDLELYYGGELYYSNDILQKLEAGNAPRMNGTRFALIEFSMNTPWKDIQAAVGKVLMLGITPIIAHIERYNALEFKKERVQELINMGCYTQINSSHILKPKLFGDKYKIFKKRARYFLEEDLVHCVASDMHNTGERKPYMAEAYRIVMREFGRKRAHELFRFNPQTLLENSDL